MFGLAFLIISTIIGAGFATGAELVSFFGSSAMPPFVIALFVGAFLLLIMSVLVIGQLHVQSASPSSACVVKSDNSSEGMRNSWFFTPVAFVFYVAMIAGIGELCGQLTAILATIVCVFVVWFGFERLLVINKFLILFVLLILFLASAPHLGVGFVPDDRAPNGMLTIGSCLLYAGMNCCMLEPVFARVLQKHSKREVLMSCLFAVLVICFLVTIILVAIRNSNVSHAMPVLALSPLFITKAAIFFSILTSMFIALLNIAHKKSRSGSLAFLFAVSTAAYVFSLLGFRTVIGVFYPIIGAVMLAFVAWRGSCFAYRHKLAHQNRLLSSRH